LANVQAYLEAKYYADDEILHSFHSSRGDQVDCIAFQSQRSVRAFEAQGVTLDPANLPPAPSPPVDVPAAIVAPDLPFAGQMDQDGQVRACPAGSVPAIRPTIQQIEAAGGLDAYKAGRASQRPLCGSTCSNQQSCFEHDCYLPGAQYSYSYEHVSGIQTSFSSSPYGMLTYMPVYKPTVSDGGEHSVSQIWMQTGSCENWYRQPGGPQQCATGNGVQNQAVQSVEAGWLVNGTNGEPQLVLFFTADGYYSYCFAGQGGDCCPTGIPDAGPNQQGTDCWVAAPGAQYTANEALEVSNLGEVTSELAVQVWNGAAHNPPYYGWFVYINGNLIGWYPPDTFKWPAGEAGAGTYGPMAYGPASYMQVGGEVLDDWNSGGCYQHTSTGMGSGLAPPTWGYGWSSYDRNVSWISGSGGYAGASLEFFLAPSCMNDYSVLGVCGVDSGYWTNDCGNGFGAYSLSTTGGQSNWGTYFFFGGGENQCKGGAAPPCTPP
jgi:hypothetical protein